MLEHLGQLAATAAALAVHHELAMIHDLTDPRAIPWAALPLAWAIGRERARAYL